MTLEYGHTAWTGEGPRLQDERPLHDSQWDAEGRVMITNGERPCKLTHKMSVESSSLDSERMSG